jgi:hypothetical protein
MGQGEGGGRPPKITKKFADNASEHLVGWFEQGMGIAEIAAELDIGKDSYYKCKKVSKKFFDAEKVGLAKSEAWWCKVGRAGAVGKVEIQPATWVFNMKNRFGWKDRVETQLTGKDGGELPALIIGASGDQPGG